MTIARSFAKDCAKPCLLSVIGLTYRQGYRKAMRCTCRRAIVTDGGPPSGSDKTVRVDETTDPCQRRRKVACGRLTFQGRTALRSIAPPGWKGGLYAGEIAHRRVFSSQSGRPRSSKQGGAELEKWRKKGDLRAGPDGENHSCKVEDASVRLSGAVSLRR